MTRTGLPHSEVRGSRPICGSPRLFAADRVLLRLLTPRHPPYAFRSLTFPRLSPCVSPQGIISDAWFVILKCSENLCCISTAFDDFLSFCLLCSFQGTTLRELCSLKTRQCRKAYASPMPRLKIKLQRLGAVNVCQSRFAFRLAFLGRFRVRAVSESAAPLRACFFDSSVTLERR